MDLHIKLGIVLGIEVLHTELDVSLLDTYTCAMNRAKMYTDPLRWPL